MAHDRSSTAARRSTHKLRSISYSRRTLSSFAAFLHKQAADANDANHLNSSVPTVVLGSSGVKRKWLRGLMTVTSYLSLSISRAASASGGLSWLVGLIAQCPSAFSRSQGNHLPRRHGCVAASFPLAKHRKNVLRTRESEAWRSTAPIQQAAVVEYPLSKGLIDNGENTRMYISHTRIKTGRQSTQTPPNSLITSVLGAKQQLQMRKERSFPETNRGR